MAANDKSTPKIEVKRPLSRLKLSGYIVLRSGAIGLISGSILGGLFGLTFYVYAFIWTGLVGAGLGLGLGIINGFLLSVAACLFFYPLKYVRFFHAMVKLISILIAAAGTAAFGPWYFSSTSMTPSSAVFIGLNSVLASIVAGWAGGIAGHNIAQWYQQKSTADTQKPADSSISHSAIGSNKFGRNLAAISPTDKSSWISVALFSLLCPWPGRIFLEVLICGDLDVAYCFPSPRLYTSTAIGIKAVFPIVLLVILIASVIRSQVGRRI